MNQPVIKKTVRFQTGRRSAKEITQEKAKPPKKGRLPRITKLMALAIRFDQLIRDGVVKDYSELARLGHVSRARITQIMNLLNLAPEIQERLLFLPEVTGGKDEITERELRPVVAEVNWEMQREIF